MDTRSRNERERILTTVEGIADYVVASHTETNQTQQGTHLGHRYLRQVLHSFSHCLYLSKQVQYNEIGGVDQAGEQEK